MRVLWTVLMCFPFTHGYLSTYRMENYCGNEISMILSSVYHLRFKLTQGSLLSTSKCRTEIEAWYSWPKLMLYFENLDIDCDEGHLEFYEGSSSSRRVEGLHYDVCGSNKPEGVFTVDDMSLQVVYVPKPYHQSTGSFSIIVTSYKSDQCPAWGYKCDNGRCINEDINCVDGDVYNACGDHSGCSGEETALIVGVSVGVSVAVVGIISVVVCCICCIRKRKGAQGSVQHPGHQIVTYNGQVAFSQHLYNTGASPHAQNIVTYNLQQGQTVPYPQAGVNNYLNQGFTSTTVHGSPPDTSLGGNPPEYKQLYPGKETNLNGQYEQLGDKNRPQGGQHESVSNNEQLQTGANM